MKQHISVKQLNELSEKGKKKLRMWFDKKEYSIQEDDFDEPEKRDWLPLPSIGQMIEFLEENDFENWWVVLFSPGHYEDTGAFIDKIYKGELCDTLWEVVREVLEK